MSKIIQPNTDKVDYELHSFSNSKDATLHKFKRTHSNTSASGGKDQTPSCN
jgi:hypothetical protein